MSEVIYRKYRPQKFQDLVSQEHIRTTLENELKTSRLGHAYLFTGPRGTGKTTTARLLAKSVNCENRKEGEAESCNKCDHCKQLMAGNFLDLIEIDAASNRGIDEIRQLRENVRFSPSHGKFKVFIIDEVHMLTTEAFNALLKTLEEPPSHAIFILATTEPHKIPETIISRCQRFDFKKVTVKDLVRRLQKIIKSEQVEVAPEVLETIAIRSEGCIRDAESLLQQVLSLGEKKITQEQAGLVIPRSDQNLVIQFTQNLFSNNIKSALELIANLTTEGVDLERFLLDFIEFLRKVMVYKSNPALELNLTHESEEKLKDLTTQITNQNLTRLIELSLQKRKDLRQSEIPQLPLELLVLEFCETDDASQNPAPPSSKAEKTKTKTSNIQHPTSNNTPKPPNKKQSNNETMKQFNNAAANVTDIKDKWSNILGEVQQQNHSVCAFLKTGQIICINNDILELGFPYKFHQDTIKEQKNKTIIEDCIKKITGQNLKIKVTHVKTPQPQDGASPSPSTPQPQDGASPSPSTPQPEASQPDVMHDMLAEFGGEVVE